jgi:hypothetical protein
MRATDDAGLYRTGKIIWVAFSAAIAAYFFVGASVSPIGVANSARLERSLMILAAAYVVASVPAKRWLLVQAQATGSVTMKRFALLVPLLLCEAAAITGLVLRLVTGSAHYYVFLLLAMAGMILNFPRRTA